MRRAGIIFFICIIIITGVLRISFLLGPVDPRDDTKYLVKIEEGISSYEIGDLLHEKNLILSRDIFYTFVTLTNRDEKLQAGYYYFKPSSSMFEIVNKMTRGRVATFRFTVPEGFNIEKIVAALAENSIHGEQEFYDLLKYGDFNREYLPPREGKYKYRLEGYLYPDTYIIPLGFSPRQIVNVMLNQFEKTWLERLEKAAGEREFSTHEIMTMASLIEWEAKLNREKPLIAAVIFNRLDKNMNLQIDAGIQYSLSSPRDPLLYRDLKIDSPYNTYLYSGLPPGPICSPGDEAIKAVLEPADVDYLFYFARQDGSHIFTETYRQHIELQGSDGG